MKSKKIGKITRPANVKPEPHEEETARFLANKLGFNIEFLEPVYQKGAHTPDIKMNNMFWELKAPKGDAKHTIQHSLRKALSQSKYVIFDLRRMKMPDNKAIAELKQKFEMVKIIKRILIITKSHILLDLKR